MKKVGTTEYNPERPNKQTGNLSLVESGLSERVEDQSCSWSTGDQCLQGLCTRPAKCQKRLFDNPHPQQDVREQEGEVTAHRKQTEKPTAIEH